MQYTYKCPICRHVQDEEHSIKDDPPIYCFRCGKEMKRVLSLAGGVIFPMSTRGHIK